MMEFYYAIIFLIFKKGGGKMKSILKVGVGVGILAGVASVIMYYVLCNLLELSFVLLNPASILIVSVIVNLIGAFIYTKLREKTIKPVMYYSLITIGVALLLSWYDWAYPPEPGIADVANIIHALVASLSITLIPRWMNRYADNK